MKINTWIKYEESYIPPRCRKPRYRACEDYIQVTLKEVDSAELKLAFEDNSFEGKGKIYFYKGKLWTLAKVNSSLIASVQKEDSSIQTPLDYLKWCNEHCSTYFRSAFDREYYGLDTSKNAVIKVARADMNKYILVDGNLFEQCTEPRYVVNVFGFGNNHGGTGLFCAYYYNPYIRKSCYFSALQGEQAVAYANKVAADRGDTNDVGKFKPFIICHMPELVRVREHGST